MKSILDPSFHYVRSEDTDVRKTFARIREEQRLGANARVGESWAPNAVRQFRAQTPPRYLLAVSRARDRYA
jgi:hypothetical protein